MSLTAAFRTRHTLLGCSWLVARPPAGRADFWWALSLPIVSDLLPVSAETDYRWRTLK
jgi:hypothetical protein